MHNSSPRQNSTEKQAAYVAPMPPSPDSTHLLLRGPFSPIKPVKGEQIMHNSSPLPNSTKEQTAKRRYEDAASYSEDVKMWELEKMLGNSADSAKTNAKQD